MVAKLMEWERVGQWYETSGPYTVCASKIMDRFKFEAWFRGNGKQSNLGIFDDAAQARRVCENHALKLSEIAP